ncbi:hypothetical protein P22_0260 [Propionispora sp. 2/2-37]|uniref:AAA family ATPase n=1 Tax=Propionispora sp. 2/2-37 TaxID=1677858 RepID=UPI0006C1746C|nr:AAA family ATPase [Propionispora sp. 2/2-37]CUH94194.1 hypothetical protein P22_0260 [Propionispora sp. 2/2-37]
MPICVLGIVKAMEDHKNELILILAGYQKEMELFLQSNPGLRSRFPIHIDFDDYNQEELWLIAEQMCSKRQYRLTLEAKAALLKILYIFAKEEHFGNARTIRNIIEKAIRRQAVRLLSKTTTTREELISIEKEDLPEVDP